MKTKRYLIVSKPNCNAARDCCSLVLLLLGIYWLLLNRLLILFGGLAVGFILAFAVFYA